MTKATTAADRKVQELGIFHDVAKALTSSLDLDSILQTIMDKMAEYFKPDNWSLLMVDEDREELYFAIVVGKAAESLKNVRLKVGKALPDGWRSMGSGWWFPTYIPIRGSPSGSTK